MRVVAWMVAFVLLAVAPGPALAASYTSSAHGDSSYGVSRSSMSGYSTGNCAHCHEMHASVGGVTSTPYPYALFYSNYVSQTDMVCLQCHDNTTTVSSRAITNRSYSYRAGGWTGDTISSVKSSFDTSVQKSAHNLSDILSFIQTQSWGFNSSSTPCIACHNPHYAQGDPFNAPNSPKTSSTRGWLLTRPSKHGSTNPSDFLWGDESGEKMSDYVGSLTYQAPYRYGSTSTYEPDGSSSTTTNGSNLADMNTFCLDCHSSDMSSYGLNNTPIDWSTSGDKHGLAGADGGIDIKAPYSGSNYGAYVLACTDCHEPHGSPNIMLIRQEVNGDYLKDSSGNLVHITNYGSSTNVSNQLGYLCRRCHIDDADYYGNPSYQNRWEYVHHYAPDHPYTRRQCGACHYSWPINCTDCHYHGAVDPKGTGRKTF